MRAATAPIALLLVCTAFALAQPAASGPTGGSATQPALDPQRALLELDQLPPLPAVATSAPADQAGAGSVLSERGAQYLRRGQELIAEERYSEAGRELEKALRSDPNRHEIHRALALAMLRAGNQERAAAHARHALQYHVDDVLPHYILGRLAHDESSQGEAVESLRRALACSNLEESPEFAALASAYLARSLEAEGYLTAALAMYREYARRASALTPSVLEANPDLAALVREDQGSAAEPIARLLERLNRPTEAAEALERVLAGEAVDAATRARYARLLAEAGRYDEALAQARDLVRDAEDPAAGVQLLVDIRGRMDDAPGVLEDVRALLAARPDRAPLVRAFVELLRRFDQPGEAERVMTEYLNAHPEAIDMAWALFDDYVQAGRTTDAFELACRTLAADPASYGPAITRIAALAKSPEAVESILSHDWPESPIHQALVGVVALRAGRGGADLIARLRDALQAAPELVLARIALGEHFIAEYRWQDVIELIGTHGEGDANLQWLLGEAHAGLDQDDQAADHYSAAIRLNRSDVRSMFALARLYERTGRELRARRQYESILEIDPLHQAAREGLIDLLIGERQIDEAQAHLAELRKMAASPNRIARCAARLELAAGGGGLERYRELLAEAMSVAGPDPDSLVLVAASYLGQDEPDSARAPLEQALKIDPGHVQAREVFVEVLVRQLRFGEAAAELRNLLKRHPRRAAWVKGLAESLRLDQDYAAAAAVLSDFLERVRLSGNVLLEFRMMLLGVLGAADRHADRITLVRGWLAEQESDRFLRAALLDAYLDAKEFEPALELTRKWYDQAPADNADLYLQVLLSAERFGAAQQLILELLEQDPALDDLLLRLSNALLQAKRHDDALEIVSTRLDDAAGGGRNLAFLVQKLRVLEDARRFDEALRLLGRMIQDENITGEGGRLTADQLQLWMAQLLFTADRLNEAQTRLARWLERAESVESRFQYLRLLAAVHQQRDLPERALESLDMAYELLPNAASINNDLGYTLAEMGQRMDDAERMVRLAVSREPTNGAYLDSLGWVMYRRGRFEDARQWLTKAARAPDERDDPVIFDHLGDACWQVFAREEAVERWSKAVTLAEERLKEREDVTYRRVLESARKKLEAAQAGEPPDVADVVKEHALPPREPRAEDRAVPPAPDNEPAENEAPGSQTDRRIEARSIVRLFDASTFPERSHVRP